MNTKLFFNYIEARNFAFLSFLFFLLISTSYKAQNCESLLVPPCRINGVNVTQSSTGSVTTYATAYTSCSNVITPANCVYVGSGGRFTYTLHFDKAVTEVTLAMTATGNSEDENFIFTTNSETPTLTTNNSCQSRIVGNQIFSGANSPSEGGGGLFTVKTRLPFTTMTISGEGGQNGTLMAFCATALSKPLCEASELIPELPENKISGNCSATNVNLKTIKALNLPTGLILTWHNESIPKLTNQIAVDEVTNGIYYAAFYDRRTNCFSQTTPLEVNIHSLPKVYAGPEISVCSGDSVVLNASGAKNYVWSNGVEQGVYFTPKESKTYIVVGTDNNNCSNSAQVQVKVVQKPNVSAGPELFITEGEKITLKAEGAQRYQWNYGLYQGAVYTPDTNKTYIVTGFDGNGCSSSDTLLFHVERKKEIKLEEIPLNNFNSAYFDPINVVFLLDISTSMIKHEKFDLLKYSVLQLLEILRPEDKLALVSFASDASVLLASSNGNEKELVKAEIKRLTVSGKSAGTKGIKRGFKVAEKNYIPNGTNMVIILTDGAITQGDDDEYLKIISKYQKQGILFSVVGIKNFPKDEEKMREAAQTGNGAYVPIFSYDDAKQNLILEIKERTFKKL